MKLQLCLVVLGALAILPGCQDGMPKWELPKMTAKSTPTPKEMEDAAAQRSPVESQPAPLFVLRDENGRPVSLTGLRGKWVVLYFYPKDDTPGCTCQATEFTELLFQFRDMNATVCGVSGDSCESHLAFIKKHDLGIPLLSDPSHETMRRYGAWVRSTLGSRSYERVIRMTYLIDSKGRVRYHWPEVIPTGHAERVRDKLAQLQKADLAGR